MRISFGKSSNKKLTKEEYFNLVKKGNLEDIKNSFQKKEIKDPKEKNENNQNVLFEMLRELVDDKKCLDILKYLIQEQNINPSEMDVNQQNILFYTCAEGLLECTKYLLENNFGIFINSIDIKGNTPLFYAVRNNNFDIVKYLVEEKNCDVNIINKENRNCLYEMNEDNASMIDFLLNKGAKSDIFLKKYMRQSGQFKVYNILNGYNNNDFYDFYCVFDKQNKQIDAKTLNEKFLFNNNQN